jgi:hypothetical protein
MNELRYPRWEGGLLLAIADGQWFGPGTTWAPHARRALALLEQRGLIEIDPTRRPMRIRIVYPEQSWLEQLDRWADQLMRREEDESVTKEVTDGPV